MRTITYYLLTNQVVESDTVYPNAFSADDNTTQLIFDFTGTACATWAKWLDLTMSDYTKDTQSLGTGAIVTFNLGAEHTKKGMLQVNPYAKNGTDKHGFPIYKLSIERQLNNSVVDASAAQSMIDYFDSALTVKAVTTETLAPGADATASVTMEADGTTYAFGLPQGADGENTVYIGDTEPVDSDMVVWIDPSESYTRFDDLFFPLSQVRIGANSLPHFDFTNNGLLFPQNDTAEYVLITVQLPHRWKEGSTIYPHLHYMQTQNVQPTFRAEYRWHNAGDAIPGSWTNYDLNVNALPYVSGSMHQILKASAGIDGTGKTISSLLEIKLYRTDNVHTGDLLAKQFDVHIEIDSLGSTEEYVK
jgi:hypothetical protein